MIDNKQFIRLSEGQSSQAIDSIDQVLTATSMKVFASFSQSPVISCVDSFRILSVFVQVFVHISCLGHN